MDIKELRTFQTIVAEGTFTRAAEKLHYAQSTITNHIKRLEKELGIQLFERGWDAKLTESGKIYAKEVDSLIHHWQSLKEKATNLKQEEVGNLYIGVTEMLTKQVLPDTIKFFNQVKPKIGCQITINHSNALAKSLLIDGLLDIVCCGEPTDMKGLQFLPLYQEEISLIVCADHPLLKLANLTLADSLSYIFVTGGPDCLYRLQLDRELASYRTEPVCHSLNQISAIPTMIQATNFVGVVLKSTSLPANIKRLNLILKNHQLPIGLLQRKQDPPLSQTKMLFRDYLEKAINNHNQLSL